MPRVEKKQDSGKEQDTPKRGSARSSDTPTGKRTSVKRVSALLSAPAQIMGPRLLFVLSIVLLAAIGLVMVYSASSIMALNSSDFGNDPAYFLKRQGLFLGMGIVVCIIVAAIPYRFWAKKPVFIVLWLLTVAILFLTAAGMGVSALGAERSISIGGFALQPSEFAKISVLLTVASLFEMQREEQLPGARFVLLLGVAVLVPLLLIYRQPDLGTAIILLVGLMVLAILVGVPWIVIIGLVVLCVLYVVYVCVTQPYHLDRITSMIDPWVDPQGKGYQSIQSLYAFGSGGIFGTGLGLSRQKYLYLPYAHTDFIYAIIGEELGLIGTVLVAALFACFIFAGLRIARSAPDAYGMSIAGGLTAMLGFQACVNMMCVIGIAPVTGKALPFISYGGSSVVASMIICGFILSVSLRSSVDAVYEQRRDNLFVLSSGKGSGMQERAGSAAAAASEAGLRVIEGFKGRVGRATEETREQVSRDGSERRARSGSGSTERARSGERRGTSTGGRRSSSSSSSREQQRSGRSSRTQQTASTGRTQRTTSSRAEQQSGSSRSQRRGSSASDGRGSYASSTRKKGYGSLDRAGKGRSDAPARSRTSRDEELSASEYHGRIKYQSRVKPQSSSQRRRHNRPGTRH